MFLDQATKHGSEMKDFGRISAKVVIQWRKATFLIFTAILVMQFGIFVERNRRSDLSVASKTTFSHEHDLESLVKLLNVDSLQEKPTDFSESMKVTKLASQVFARSHSDSFISQYEALRSNCSIRPYKPSLLSAMHRSLRTLGTYDQKLLHAVSSKGVLLVLSDDHRITSEFLRSLVFVLRNERIRKVMLISTHPYVHRDFVKQVKKEMAKEVRRKVQIRLINVRTSIAIFGLVNRATMVLLHGSSVAALLALVATNRVYFSEKMRPFAEQDRFRWAVSELRPTNDSLWAVNGEFQSRFSEMGTVEPTCCEFAAFGKFDDEKIVCINGKAFQSTMESSRGKFKSVGLGGTPLCWVLAIGCGNRWNFENSVIQETECVVQTFDCTDSFEVPGHLRNRVEVHKLCIGVSDEANKDYRTLSELIKIGSTRSGLKEGTPPALVKMDVEGWEHPVLHELLDKSDDSLLPEQMVIEIHVLILKEAWPHFLKYSNDYHETQQPRIRALFEKLEKKGYVLVHRADNPKCPGCTEINIMKRSGLPPS